MFAVPDNTVARVEDDPALAHPVRTAMRTAAERDNWRHLLSYDPEQRFATLLSSDARQQVWLLSWLPGQRTDLHDHGAATGAFTVVEGALTESVARRGSGGGAVESVHTLRAGQSRVFAPGYVHQVVNAGPEPAVSVHVYRVARRTLRPHHLDPLNGPVRDR